MTPKEILEHEKSSLDEAIYNALLHLNTPGKNVIRVADEMLTISYTYKKALLAVADESSEELAEHYRLLAEQAVPKVEFLMASVLLYRGRCEIAWE